MLVDCLYNSIYKQECNNAKMQSVYLLAQDHRHPYYHINISSQNVIEQTVTDLKTDMKTFAQF